MPYTDLSEFHLFCYSWIVYEFEKDLSFPVRIIYGSIVSFWRNVLSFKTVLCNIHHSYLGFLNRIWSVFKLALCSTIPGKIKLTCMIPEFYVLLFFKAWKHILFRLWNLLFTSSPHAFFLQLSFLCFSWDCQQKLHELRNFPHKISSPVLHFEAKRVILKTEWLEIV